MTCCDYHRINCRQGRDCPNRKSRVSKSGARVRIIVGITWLYLGVQFCWLVWGML
jgi:hypothetical protein